MKRLCGMEDNKAKDLALSLENNPPVRTVWYQGRLYFSLVDIVDYLNISKKPSRSYWAQLKARLPTEGFQDTLTKIIKLPLRASDGRMRETDCADRETVLRIIQSIPSPKAEPFKVFLAKVGNERLDELQTPLAADADFLAKQQVYLDKGYNEEWARLRTQCDLIRNALTDTWQDRGITTSLQFSILTDTMHAEAFGLPIKAHKAYKRLSTRDNLRDHMIPVELGLQAFTEGFANTLHQSRNSHGYTQILIDVTDAGRGGRKARETAEEILGGPLVSSENYKHLLKGRTKRKELPEPTQPQSIQLPKQVSLFDQPEQSM